MMTTRVVSAVALAGVLLAATGCTGRQPGVTLELFLVSPAGERAIAYGRLSSSLSRDGGDPDTVARRLVAPTCAPAILHSTSWRWEKDGTLVLTYLAFSEDPRCGTAEPSRLAWTEVLPPPSTDPLKPRPAEIREQDVLAHGLRHLTFLARYSVDRRIAAALSPRSLEFFQSMCGQLAGRYETAREFADCGQK
jgi:hypothetical protein